jgi:hypothetical protein
VSALEVAVATDGTANPERGEAAITVAGITLTLRPSFEALVRVEEELGPLLGWVEKVGLGGVTIGEIVGLFWHCLTDKPGELTRDRLGEAVVEAGLAAATPVLRMLIGQILKGL